jgi:hypothetical protein
MLVINCWLSESAARRNQGAAARSHHRNQIKTIEEDIDGMQVVCSRIIRGSTVAEP